MLAHGVVAATDPGPNSRDRPNGRDAPFALDNERRKRLCDFHDAEHIDVKKPAHITFVLFNQRSAGGDAGIVDQAVKTSAARASVA